MGETVKKNKTGKEKTIKKRSLKTTWIQVSVLPAFVLGVMLTCLLANSLINGMTKELSESLSVAAHSLYNTYSLVAPGDYVMDADELKKGDMVLSGDYTIIDALKDSYHMEMTLFYADERVLTTIKDEAGNRVIGTKADPEATKWVLEKNREFFVKNIEINGVDYYGYYIPVLNKDETVVGMAFAGKTSESVMDSVQNSVARSVMISIMIIFVALFWCIFASQKIIESLHLIMEYLGCLAKTDFSQRMPDKVLKRNDEIGEMGRYAATVNRSLKELITSDPLTKLSNRRDCGMFLEKKISLCEKYQENKICVAIGDIDFFKSINDKYGHDCGDYVLVTVADVFKKHMEDRGLVARWGGEEFLFVFEKPLAEAKQDMQDILNEIRAIDFAYEEKHFKVTLSVGMNGTIVGSDFDTVIKIADDMLYQGKESGRNRIVTTEGETILP